MVTIIIPCYNYARFLPDAVASALGQSRAGLEIEVLVLDDGSTDDTALVAAGFGPRLRYIRQPNSGLSSARNAGMREASNDMVLFLDADDVLRPGAVACLLEAWNRTSHRLAIMAGREQVVDVELRPSGPPPLVETGIVQEITARDLVLRNRFAPAVLADRRALIEVGGFEPALRASEDRDMWIRVASQFRVAKLDRITLSKRDHGGNMSRAASRQTECIRQVIARAAGNPNLALQPADFRMADAVCWYQSGLMFAEAGEAAKAAGCMLRSIAAAPWISSRETDMPLFSRSRALASLGFIMLRKTFLSCLRPVGA